MAGSEFVERFRPRKRWGQHFLADRKALGAIAAAADLKADDLAMEIGPGKGALTEAIAAKAGKVIAIEIDRKLVGLLKEKFVNRPQVRIVAGDFLETGLERLLAGEEPGKKIKVLGNLPYYITTPILVRLLEERRFIDTIVVTVQKEVARRLAAEPGGRDRGAISVFVQFYADAGIVRTIRAQSFRPRPKVDSAVVRLKILPGPRVSVGDEERFFRLVRRAFGQRRKMLVNTLAGWPEAGFDKERWTGILAVAAIDPRRRAEELSLEEFARVERELGKATYPPE